MWRWFFLIIKSGKKLLLMVFFIHNLTRWNEKRKEKHCHKLMDRFCKYTCVRFCQNILHILELLFWLDFKKNPKQNCGGTCVESVLFSKKFYQNNKLWMCTYTLVKFLEQQTVKLYINRWWWRSGTCDSIFEIHSERKKIMKKKWSGFRFYWCFKL